MSKKAGYSRIIGIIGKPYGMNGYVFVRMVTDYPETISDGTRLYLDENRKNSIIIQNLKTVSSKNGLRTVIKFLNCDCISDAEKLRGQQLYRAAEDQPALDSDTNWIDELIGCDVKLKENSRMVGTVINVEKCAFNDNLILSDNANRTMTIPMYDEYIERIDIKNKVIILRALPEYI